MVNTGVYVTSLTEFNDDVGSNAACFIEFKVIDHYENPRNVGSLDKGDKQVGTGLVGAPACGDVMKLQIKVSSYESSDERF